MNLIIVESPTKANTIAKFLGPKYRVLSSYGHVRDLPKSELGVDVEKNFQPKYIVPTKSKKIINLLKKELLKADEIILATDEDREGEAISWHLASILGLNGEKKYQRIVFHEITKQAIEEALKNPRKIDLNLVDAQQARRVLDRIVGYKLSPFLWKKVARGLSAGRVQSVAVVLVVEREREIEKFIPQEYWSIEASLRKEKNKKEFIASLVKKDDKPIDKLEIKNKEEADKIINDLTGAEYKVSNIEKKEVKRNPLPPFTTSTLQQAAWQKFKFSAKFTMQLAQRLYESGSITYHRTDSLNLSDISLFAAKNFIEENYGEKYWAGYLRRFKTKSKRAQEAHEAIRPSYPDKTPSSLFGDKKKDKMAEAQLKLYNLIWSRFIACQMNQAVFDATTIDIGAKNYTFRINGQALKFDGFLRVYPIKFKEAELPVLEREEVLELIELLHSQHFTQPPARYNEATLIKALEENGIGRPSTYAPILSNIQDKNYIEKNDQKRFRPTEIGTVVSDILVAHFPEIVDVNFTAGMEENLDQVAEGKKEWTGVIREFYQPFAENLEKKYKEVLKKDVTETPTEKICPKCKAPLLIRLGKYGKFYACSAFPKCRHTESLEENALKIKCPKCKNGKLVEKRTKKRKIFYGCNQFPKCDFALWDKPIEKFCPKCKSILVETKREQVKCSNKECDYKIEKKKVSDKIKSS
ncbi:MAG: type I DNA topoisomerase [Candidatus Nealsonbacteria bacterium]|nr:type I DNA topoisomerase [Candidatus Nealsonbacteria bacterium]